MKITRNLQYLFVHAPNVGGTILYEAFSHHWIESPTEILARIENPSALGSYFKKKNKLPPHLSLRELLWLFGHRPMPKLVFMVRNPFERMLSFYNYARVKQIDHAMSASAKALSFSDWLKFIAVGNGSFDTMPFFNWAVDTNGCARFDYLFRFELVDQQIKNSPLGDPDPGFKRTYAPIDWRPSYDASAIRIIKKLYALDLELFGYGFDDFDKPAWRGFLQPESDSL